MAPYGLTRNSLSGDGDVGGDSGGMGDFVWGCRGPDGSKSSGKKGAVGNRAQGGSSTGGGGKNKKGTKEVSKDIWGGRGPSDFGISGGGDGTTDITSNEECTGEISDESFGGRLWGPEDY